MRIPVDHPHAAIDFPLAEQIDKYANYATRIRFIHREIGAFPVAGGTEFFQLFKDDAAMFARPFPGMFQKLFARQVVFPDAFGSEFRYHLGFGGNRRMVGARHPAGIFALHSRTAHQHVLNGIVEHVPHVQHAGYVRRRNHDGIRLAFVGLGMK